jgi:uncharacterized protein YkwD
VIPSATLLLVALALSPAEIEKRAASHIRGEYERIGRAAPQLDPRLERAARTVAANALETGPSEAADPLALSEAVSDADGWDPHPRWVVVRASRPELALESLEARSDLNEEPATHVGIAVATRGDRSAVAVMLTQRRAELSSFPRRFERAPAVQTLCGTLGAGLGKPAVYVTRPDGGVDRVSLSRRQGDAFCSKLDFRQVGRFTVEVIGHGDRGPEVASIFYVDVGPRSAVARTRLHEPATVEEARLAILARINALREAHGQRPLRLNAQLTGVAQAYSERMAKENFFAHVSPDGTDVRARVRGAGYLAQLVGENLGLAHGPLAAHFGIEQSPGHRKNLLEPDYLEIGIGVAFQKREGRTQTLVTEVMGTPVKVSSDPLGDAYRTLAERRAALKLPALRRNPVLEEIARDHAAQALKLNQPQPNLPGSAIHERVFRALEDVNGASVDVFIAESPASLPSSKSLADGRNRLVGIGTVRGSSPKYGRDKFWVVVIYASPG